MAGYAAAAAPVCVRSFRTTCFPRRIHSPIDLLMVHPCAPHTQWVSLTHSRHANSGCVVWPTHKPTPTTSTSKLRQKLSAYTRVYTVLKICQLLLNITMLNFAITVKNVAQFDSFSAHIKSVQPNSIQPQLLVTIWPKTTFSQDVEWCENDYSFTAALYTANNASFYVIFKHYD